MIILQTQLMGIHNNPGKITAVILRTEETAQERKKRIKDKTEDGCMMCPIYVAGVAGTEEDEDEFKEEMVLRENE